MIIEVREESDFSIHNIPFGIFSTQETPPRVGIAIGDYVLDLAALSKHGVFEFDTDVLDRDSLNDFISLGKAVTAKVRKDIQSLLLENEGILANNKESLFLRQSDVIMHMPVGVGDYTDFYSSIEHATNVGKLFRDPENALLPNWKHLPVGYHGRASSIIVSGQDIHRPCGQTKPANADAPIYGPSKRLDFELEMAFIIGKENPLGNPILIDEAHEYIFGMVLFNDWSARDIQKWEYVPLGPFLGKSFASSISPWVVTMEALQPYHVNGPIQEPEVLPYLRRHRDANYDINLQVSLTPIGGKEEVICNSNYKFMYWDMNQQLTHHTVNGCNVKVGDMMASGTISGKDEQSYGSLLEMSYGGKKPLELSSGNTRTFIEDGDRITMRGFAEKEGKRVGFGKVTAKILSAKNNDLG